MATILNQAMDAQEQICYVQCTLCTTMLLVNVPYSSMGVVVTVRCGHCNDLLSVNMLKASFLPFHLFSPLNQDQHVVKCQEEVDASKEMIDTHRHSTTFMGPSSEDDTHNDNDDDEELINLKQIVNKPPEKKRRAPSVYNKFIKEEIKRLKARNPTMNHKQAFSTAAKNWAHFPSVQNEVDDEEDSD